MKLNIHIHVHHEGESPVMDKLNQIITQNKKIMAKQEQFDAMLQRLDASTNDIAADLKLLKDQIAAGNISDESLAKLDTNIAKLEELGASTENPVPDDGNGGGEENPGGETGGESGGTEGQPSTNPNERTRTSRRG